MRWRWPARPRPAAPPWGCRRLRASPIEEVVAANGKIFFQIYWLGGRDAIAERVERAKDAGAVGLIATTDWSFCHGRDWGSPKIPEKMDLKTMLKMAPEVLTKPRWLWSFGKTLRPPDLRVPNQGHRGEPGPTFFEAYGQWMGTPPPTWEDIAWLREQWGGPFMLKGIVRVDDAKRAVDAGVSAISVSNHGGNNLDGTPAAIRACPPSPRRSATRSRCCWTAVSGAAATSSRPSPSAPAR